MRIVSLKQTSPEHITLGLEDGGELRTTLGVVTELRLFSGRELDETELAELRRQSGCALARERALAILSQRQMSARELKRKLLDKGLEEENADFCVAWAQEHDLIDEQSYASAIVRHYSGKGYGEGRVRQELQRRGVPRELWEDALATLPQDQSAQKLDRFIAARLKDPGDREAVRKLTASLFRRGYSYEEIRAALARFDAETCEESI